MEDCSDLQTCTKEGEDVLRRNLHPFNPNCLPFSVTRVSYEKPVVLLTISSEEEMAVLMLCLCIFTQPEALQPFHVVAGISPLLRDSLLSHGPWYYGMTEGRLGSEEEGGPGEIH